MPAVDYSALWAVIKTAFYAVASILAALGLGEAGGRVMAALLFAALFFLTGVFKKTRRVVGPLLAIAIIISILLALV